MSAESPIPSKEKTDTSSTVSPQPVTDPTILDSVAGFINDVVPTNYSDSIDTKDQIQWARFEQLDDDESTLFPIYSNEKIVLPPLILIMGYTTGIQVWAIAAGGEASEIFSWRYGTVKALKILPCPYIVGSSKIDMFLTKRPLIALCDTVDPSFPSTSLNLYSLKTGEQVKMIKFKSPILEILANRRSLVITFCERIAIFDAFTLEDRLSVTSCYLSPGLMANPVAVGPRWLAYAEKKLNASKRSNGGNEGEGTQSYTATVLHAAKSLGRGLRELGESVASSLTGNQTFKPGTSPSSPQAGGQTDVAQKGIVTVLDIEGQPAQYGEKTQSDLEICHFVAHMEAIVALQFDPSGLLLLTADKRGHNFHLFRIHPHPGGSALATVHHLYTLHRGDTSAKVQDMCFSFDSRWVTASTLRGTTHVFPVTPYGGNIGVRTHASLHVVNKMSRFHRSAGLTAEGRSNSPVSIIEYPVVPHLPYYNPRYPPFPCPVVVQPLAQIRQPVYVQNINTTPRQGRQRLPSSSEEYVALRVAAHFAAPRAWMNSQSSSDSIKQPSKPVDSLFIMSCHGTLVQYDMEPHPASSIPKERVCDDTPIELKVTAKAQWLLQRQPDSPEVPLPLSMEKLKLISHVLPTRYETKKMDHNDDDWLSQVEIVTHAGPHRRLWMGPQFTFKTYTTTNGSPMSLVDAQPLDLSRSKPVNMPISKTNTVLIESGSASSCEQSLLDTYHKTCEEIGTTGEHQIKEDLADAMIECTGMRNTGNRCLLISMKPHPTTIAKVVNPLGMVVTIHSDDEHDTVVDEEAVILENCDEALFRPLVASKALWYQNAKQQKQCLENIITKSLGGNTEVAVEILKKSPVPPNQATNECTDKKINEREVANACGKSKSKSKSNKLEANTVSDLNSYSCTNDASLVELNFESPSANENTYDASNSKTSNSLKASSSENDTKPTKQNTYSKKAKAAKDKSFDLDLSFETAATFDDNVVEERVSTKKIRKPKPKLGVKITSADQENSTKVESVDMLLVNNDSDSKKAKKVSMGSGINLVMESTENILFNLPSFHSLSEDLIDVQSPQQVSSHDTVEVIGTTKHLKSSDYDKGDSGSSPVESTESDDSGKNSKVENSIYEDPNENLVPKSRSAKRRLKKKKK